MFALRAAAAGCIVSGQALLPRAGHVSGALRNSRGCASASGRLADASPSTELPRWGFVPLERGRQLTSMVRRDGEKFVEYYKLQCVTACVSILCTAPPSFDLRQADAQEQQMELSS